jgi:hypothetical protein
LKDFIINGFKLLLFSSLFVYMGLVAYAGNIPFMFHNELFVRLFVITFVGYVVLGAFLIFILMRLNEIDKSELKDLMIKTKNLACLGYLVFPLALGYAFSHLISIPADFFASEFTVTEFTITKLEQRRRPLSYLSEVTVDDKSNKSKSFFLSNIKIDKLDLNRDDKITVIGRDSYFGLVIDNINGVQVN